MTQRRRAIFFAREARQRGDIETDNTTARPRQGSLETGITSAPENCTKNAHFSPAKAMTVSIPRERERAKVTAVSDKAQPAPAKAMAVSDKAQPAPAKVTAVSDKAQPAPTKVTAVSDKARPAPTKAMAVSDNRPSWPTGSGCGARRRRQGLAGLRAEEQAHISTPGPTGVKGAGGICRGAGGRWRGLAGLRGDAPSEARSADGSRAGRRPPAHTAAGPSGTRNTRGYTQQPGPAGHAQQPAPAGGRGLRHPEHQRRNMPPRHNKTARPHWSRAAQSVSKAQRRITTMSGSPRPLSWRTLEIPSLEATSFAVPSMRGSS